MISVSRLAKQFSICCKNFNVAIFSDNINLIHNKLCMIVVLTEISPFISLLVTLIVFQGHRVVKQF